MTPPIKVLTVEQMRATEAAADSAGLSYAELMNRAGRAIAERVKALATADGTRVAVLVGKGNNGGDGLIAGRLLAEETNALVSFFLLETPDETHPQIAALRERGLLIADAPTDGIAGFRVLRTMVGNADIVIDALLGIGARLPLDHDLEKIMRNIRTGLRQRREDRAPIRLVYPAAPNANVTPEQPYILSVDVPTGLDADTGALDHNALQADETITFHAVKPGLITFPGANATGKLTVAPLGIPEKTQPSADSKHIFLTAGVVKALLPERPLDGHKGTFGKALIVAGSIQYTGAPSLSANAAYRGGAGLVTVAAPQPIIGMINAHSPESTWLILPHDLGVISEGAARVIREAVPNYHALLIGPGVGQEAPTATFLDTLFSSATSKARSRGIGFAPTSAAEKDAPKEITLPPMVIDADALNLLAKIDGWHARLPARSILTPHPGEMARLCGFTDGDLSATEQVQRDRLGLVSRKAAEWNQIVVLKGAYTLIASPDGRVAVAPFATSALSKAGTGDVLAGVIVALLAQGLDPFDAAAAGVYLHGLAGVFASYHAGHAASVTARDVAEQLGAAIRGVEDGEA
jgi:NAD(P)H-hydrate epimerase